MAETIESHCLKNRFVLKNHLISFIFLDFMNLLPITEYIIQRYVLHLLCKNFSNCELVDLKCQH